ncbi:hypothetical protein Tco_0862248 [Tanacetum coccineum]
MPTEMELTLEQTQQGVSYEVSVLSDIEDSHGPSDAMHNLPSNQRFSKYSCFISHGDYTHFYRLSHSELVDIEKMEILLEPTSNKLMVGDLYDSIRIKLVTTGKKRWCDSIRIKLVPGFYTSAGNPVNEILLKLNQPDHRILKDGGEDFRYSDTKRLSRSDEVIKLKNFKKDATLKLSKLTNQEWYEHVGPEVTSYTRWQDSLR